MLSRNECAGQHTATQLEEQEILFLTAYDGNGPRQNGTTSATHTSSQLLGTLVTVAVGVVCSNLYNTCFSLLGIFLNLSWHLLLGGKGRLHQHLGLVQFTALYISWLQTSGKTWAHPGRERWQGGGSAELLHSRDINLQ